jgi:acetate kinase
MGTRCGDIDPAIPMVMQRTLGLSAEQVDSVLNRKSGVLGISGVSSDMRDINEKADAGHAQARLALEIFAYRIKKYIGAYIAAMNGVDLIIFTAGIGERGRSERRLVLEEMEFLGIVLDCQANEEAFGKFGTISAKESKVCVMVVPTNEELEIAEQTLKVITNGR